MSGRWAIVVAVLACAPAVAAADEADKSKYTLFNPTPDALLRDFAPDRPDVTQGAFTVDAGHVQFETTLFGFSRSRPDSAGTVSDRFEFGTTQVRLGVTNDAELEFGWQPYGIVRNHAIDPTVPARSTGIGGLTIGGKYNFWGNDTFEKPGATALAILPFVNVPTDRGNGIGPDFVSGGFIVPFAIKLSDKFDITLNTGVNWVRDDDAARYHTEYLNSASLSYEWSDKWSTYYEISTRFGTGDPRGGIVMLGTGVAYNVKKNLQLDAGVNFGVTPAADRINPFVGMSSRF